MAVKSLKCAIYEAILLGFWNVVFLKAILLRVWNVLFMKQLCFNSEKYYLWSNFNISRKCTVCETVLLVKRRKHTFYEAILLGVENVLFVKQLC